MNKPFLTHGYPATSEATHRTRNPQTTRFQPSEGTRRLREPTKINIVDPNDSQINTRGLSKNFSSNRSYTNRTETEISQSQFLDNEDDAFQEQISRTEHTHRITPKSQLAFLQASASYQQLRSDLTLREKKVPQNFAPLSQSYLSPTNHRDESGELESVDLLSATKTTAYSCAMKALQRKIKELELKYEQSMKMNDELAQRLEFEMAKTNRYKKEIEAHKKMENQICEQIQILESETKRLTKLLEEQSDEKVVFEEKINKLKLENLRLREENSVSVQKLEESAKRLADSETTGLKKEKEFLEKRNDELQQKCEKLERELEEVKQSYKDYLQEVILKKEALREQFEHSREIYVNQLNDIRRDISQIETDNTSKVIELQKDNEILQEKVNDLIQKKHENSKEIEELKENLSKFVNHTLNHDLSLNHSLTGFSTGRVLESPMNRLTASKMGNLLSQLNLPQRDSLLSPHIAHTGSTKTMGGNNYKSVSDAIDSLDQNVEGGNQNYFSEVPRNTASKQSPFRPQSSMRKGIEEQFYTPASTLNQSREETNQQQYLYVDDPFATWEESDNTLRGEISDFTGVSRKNEKNYNDFAKQDDTTASRGSETGKIGLVRHISFGDQPFVFETMNGNMKLHGYKQDGISGQIDERSFPQERRSQNKEEDYVSLIENILAVEKELENTNREYNKTLQRLQV